MQLFVLDLPPGPVAAATARQAARGTLLEWGHGDAALLADAELVVHELVANAVEHGATEDGARPQLRVEVAGGALRLAVADGSSVLPVAHELDVRSQSGRGLRIVAALSTRWGVEEVPAGGKRVWVELPLDPRARAGR